MRLSVSINPVLLEKAKKEMGLRTKKETIELALKELLRKSQLKRVVTHFGKSLVDLSLKELLALRKKS